MVKKKPEFDTVWKCGLAWLKNHRPNPLIGFYFWDGKGNDIVTFYNENGSVKSTEPVSNKKLFEIT